MMGDKKVSLRVLYTINSSPQYILARSHARVPVDFIPFVEENGGPASLDASKYPPLYANVSLKICLDTICRSSPELTQDSNRDFSLYVLDPLESNSAPAPVNISNTNSDSLYSSNNSSTSAEQPRGVAVGLGFMSWALTADDADASTVVGTLVQQANGQQALEVIFALRETMAMKRPVWNMQPPSSQPISSQESSTSLNEYQKDIKPLISRGSSMYHHPTQSGSTIQTRSYTADTTRETLASIQMRAKAKIKPPKPVRQSTIPVTESDKFLNAGTYIGPLKKKGRPKASGTDSKPSFPNDAVASGSGSRPSHHQNDVIVIDGSDSEGIPPTPTARTFTQSATGKSGLRTRTSQPFTTEPLVKRTPNDKSSEATVKVKLEPQDAPSILDILAYLSATSSEPNAQNAAILTALHAIDSSNTQGKQPEDGIPNPQLVSALKQLLSVYANSPLQPRASENPNPETAKHHRQSPSHIQEETVVVRDKENVDPFTYQKRAEDGKMKYSETTMGASSPPGSSRISMQGSYSDRQSNSLGRSTRSNENISQKAPSKDNEKLVRKRTLSDFMDEKEKGKGKGKERERVEKRDGHRHSGSYRPLKLAPVVDSLRHYPRILASNQPRTEQPANYYRVPLESMTSPARPRPQLDITVHGQANNTDDGSGAIAVKSRTPSPRPSRISASSPVRGVQNETRRKYVVPEWARTSTSTQPRLSEEAQRTLEEVEERKRQERAAARKRLPSIQAKLKAKSVLGTAQPKGNQAKPLPAPPPPSAPQTDIPRGPIIASSDKPLFPAANIHFPFVSSTRSSSPPPQAKVVPNIPMTPIRERRNVLATPVRENESLFTPLGSGSLFGSARSLRTPVAPSVLTSPLGNRKKAKLSPMTSALTGKGFRSISWDNHPSSAPTSSDSKDMESDKASKNLDRELEDALDDLDCPPSSLPIASSDIDVDSSYLSVPVDVDDVENRDENGEIPVKQHWAGLPPSSPPPPSSPMILPEHDGQTDDEMDDLPIATSDSEVDADTDMNGCETDAPSPAVASPCDDNNAADNGDFSFFSLPEYTSAESGHISSSDLFEQFTNLNDHSDTFPDMNDIQFDPAMEEIFQNGLDNLDLSELWNTFNPIINGSTQSAQNQTIGEYLSQNHDGPSLAFEEIDHVKLADEMQTLLSGCLM